METDKWNAFVLNVQGWIEENADTKDDDIEDAIMILQMNIRRGNKQIDKRDRAYTSCKHELATINRQDLYDGRNRTPQAVINAVAIVKVQAEAGFSAFWDACPEIAELRGTKGIYENKQAFIDHKLSSVSTQLKKMFNAGIWNGEYTPDGGFTLSFDDED